MNINDILNLLLEDKSHLINKANLSDEEKYLVVKHFKQFPHKEKMIDWNKLSNLKFSDFKKVMDTDSKTHTKNKIKAKGLEGLSSPKDYETIYKNGSILAVMPKSWKASKLIASTYIGDKEGKWCTAYQKDQSFWNIYNYDNNGFLIYVIDFNKKDKIALSFSRKRGNGKVYCWDSEDLGISKKEFNKFLFNNEKFLNDEVRSKKLIDLINKGIKIRDDKDRFPVLRKTWRKGTWGK